MMPKLPMAAVIRGGTGFVDELYTADQIIDFGREVAEACAVQAWNTGMDLHSSGKVVMDTREAGSKCAAAIREAAKEIK